METRCQSPRAPHFHAVLPTQAARVLRATRIRPNRAAVLRLTFASNIGYIRYMSRPLKYRLDVFDALANPIRRDLIRFLKANEVAATALVEHFKIRQPSLSRHLQVLRRAGLVRQRQQGCQRLYRLNRAALREAERWIRAQLQT